MARRCRQLVGALERIGGLLEQTIVQEPSWQLGAVERESGALEAHVLVGWGRAPAHLRFALTTAERGMTQVEISVVAKSAWSSQRSCFEHGDRLLDAVVSRLQQAQGW